MRKNVGVLIGLLVFGAILISVSDASSWSLYWNQVTNYTDNTAIEPTKTVSYTVRIGGVVQGNVPCNPAPDGKCTWLIPSSIVSHNKNLLFDMQTKLDTGEVSVWTPPFAWTSPPGIPAAASGIGVR